MLSWAPADKVNQVTELSLSSALERGKPVMQFALSKRLSVSAGLVNALLKRSMQRGWAKAPGAQARRWAYDLTPKGFAEKGQLVAADLECSLAFFREAREQYAALFSRLRALRVQRLVLVGRVELAEIALPSAHETGVEIGGLRDWEANGERLHGVPILRHPDEPEPSAALVMTESHRPQAAFEKLRGPCGARRIVAPALDAVF